MGGEWKDNPEAAALASRTHGIYSIRDQMAYAEKLALFKSEPGREDVRAELGVVLYDMFQAWKAYLFGFRDDPEALLMAPVNTKMAVYLNLLFRLIDTWPSKADSAALDAELQHISEVVERHRDAA